MLHRPRAGRAVLHFHPVKESQELATKSSLSFNLKVSSSPIRELDVAKPCICEHQALTQQPIQNFPNIGWSTEMIHQGIQH